jgi:hypothetical protein
LPPPALDDPVERVGVLYLYRGHEVAVRARQERGRIGRADHERIAEQRLDVLVVGDALGARLELVAQRLGYAPAPGEAPEDLLERLVLVALDVRVDRHRERRPGRDVGERGLERIP